MPHATAIAAALWTGWLLYWMWAARGVKATAWREPALSQALHRVPLTIAAFLFIAPRAVPAVARAQIVPPTPALAVLGLVAVASGLWLAVSARAYLGRNWSAEVTVKSGHLLIRTGPYRHMRHPIYTGILLALFGTVLVVDAWRCVVGLALVVAGLLYKIGVEEKRMRETFPDYDAYARTTAALVPFVY